MNGFRKWKDGRGKWSSTKRPKRGFGSIEGIGVGDGLLVLSHLIAADSTSLSLVFRTWLSHSCH